MLYNTVTPKLSIITINYNNLSGLKKTIESVLAQTFKDFEYIIIDGGSTDGSREIIQQHVDKLRYWVSEKDNGIYHAMNKGIMVAKTEYLLFLNSGDWLVDAGTLNTVQKYLQDDDIIYGNVLNLKKDGTEWLHNPPSKLSLYDLGYCRTSLPHQAMFIKKDLFSKHGYYDESLQLVSDWAFYLTAIFKYNCSYRQIDTVVAYYDFSGVTADAKNEELQKAERMLVLNKHFLNWDYLIQDYGALKSKLWCYENSRLVKAFKKFGFLKFRLR